MILRSDTACYAVIMRFNISSTDTHTHTHTQRILWRPWPEYRLQWYRRDMWERDNER